ncbi:helix-turn-helix transcriptional regulator [Brevibacterium daeguense]|uniref:helix-turn-helix transcriptional regulator n=1 Tax=Brevibacterium daeguense TaxID=909936 RepID=UPI001F16B8D6
MNDAEKKVREQTERILNLLIALRATAGWTDRDTLKSCIDEYAGLSDSAFDRAFSRDKSLLRTMGIEISTTSWKDAHTGANGYGYRITQDDYALPEIDLTPEEAAVLSVASRFWQDSALGIHTGRALNKLRGLGIDLHASAEDGAPEAPFDTESFSVALSAVNARRAVEFDYRKPGGPVSHRRLEPYTLLTRGDRVYLIGRDIDKDDIRTFRLARVEGRISPVRRRKDGDYEIPDDFRVSDWFRPDRASGPAHTARVRVRPGRADPVRRIGTPVGAEDGWDVLEISCEDPEELAASLLGYGAAVRPAAPPELVAAHEEMLRRTRDALAQVLDGKAVGR